MNKSILNPLGKEKQLVLMTKVVLIFLFSCRNQDTSLELDSRYDNVKTIQSTASCAGPSGSYQTVIHSAQDYMLFIQDYLYNGKKFEGVLHHGVGLVLDSANQILDSMSLEQSFVVRSHDFHMVSMRPQNYFHDIAFKKKVSDLLIFTAVDELGNSTILKYNPRFKQIQGFAIRNPSDTTEEISVLYTDWVETKFGPIANSLEISQGEHSQYTFQFEEVLINDQSFEFRKPLIKEYDDK